MFHSGSMLYALSVKTGVKETSFCYVSLAFMHEDVLATPPVLFELMSVSFTVPAMTLSI